MIFVLIVTTVLLMLGLMTITVSQMNYKMKLLNSQGKKSFYVLEALIEEVEMKLHDYVGQAVVYSYSEVRHDKTSQNFKSIYREEIKKINSKLEDISDYSIKTQEGYKVTIAVELKECVEKDVLDLHITSTIKDKKITEKIKTQYKIITPEYMDYEYGKRLVNRVGWMNYKW